MAAELQSMEPPMGSRLPSVRELAKKLDVHSTTVRSAYNLLESEGLVISHVGKGTFVSRDLKTTPFFKFPLPIERTLSLCKLHSEMETLPSHAIDFFSFCPEVTDEGLKDFSKALEQALDDADTDILSYHGTHGIVPLRQIISRYISSGNKEVKYDQVMITSGAQQALDLVIRCFVGQGDSVVATCPTYINLMGTLESIGARLIPIGMNSDNIDLESVERACQDPSARLIYIMPTFHNPTGITLDLETRLKLLSINNKYRLPILEDDLENGLGYEGAPPPSLFSLDNSKRTIQIGSFSKALFPGLRIGWIAGTKQALSRFLALKRFSDLETSAFPQFVLTKFLDSGLLEKHISRLKPQLKKKRDLILESLGKYMPEGVNWTMPKGGLSLWVEFPPSIDGRELAEAAKRQDVIVAPGDLFFPEKKRVSSIRIAFAKAPLEKIEQGVKILATLAKERVELEPTTGKPATAL